MKGPVLVTLVLLRLKYHDPGTYVRRGGFDLRFRREKEGSIKLRRHYSRQEVGRLGAVRQASG